MWIEDFKEVFWDSISNLLSPLCDTRSYLDVKNVMIFYTLPSILLLIHLPDHLNVSNVQKYTPAKLFSHFVFNYGSINGVTLLIKKLFHSILKISNWVISTSFKNSVLQWQILPLYQIHTDFWVSSILNLSGVQNILEVIKSCSEVLTVKN